MRIRERDAAGRCVGAARLARAAGAMRSGGLSASAGLGRRDMHQVVSVAQSLDAVVDTAFDIFTFVTYPFARPIGHC